MENILKVENLNKSYENFSLTDVSFSLPKDCITGFIGVNGAGKTTTIRAILGLVSTSSGSIEIFGKDLKSHEQEIKNRIGIVLDDGYFYESLTMEQMKSIIAPAYSNWQETEYQEYMKRFDLNPRQKIGTLSKGMKMKFALTLALSHRADLLIMDEPTGGLDPLVRSDLLGIIREYMQQDEKSVFFSTHITSDLDKIADLLVLIHDGKILFQDSKDDILDNHRVVKGDRNLLTEQNSSLFLNTDETNYNFTALTDNVPKVKKLLPNCLLERPTIEDIMLAYIRRSEKNATLSTCS